MGCLVCTGFIGLSAATIAINVYNGNDICDEHKTPAVMELVNCIYAVEQDARDTEAARKIKHPRTILRERRFKDGSGFVAHNGGWLVKAAA